MYMSRSSRVCDCFLDFALYSFLPYYLGSLDLYTAIAPYSMHTVLPNFHIVIVIFKVEIVKMIEELDRVVSKMAQGHIYGHTSMNACVRILCIDPAECHQPDSNLRPYEG
jgi:hypothetical protein